MPGFCSAMATYSKLLRDMIRDTWRIFLVLARIMVPMAFLARVFQRLGFIDVLARGLEPVMGAMRLPGEMGLVWATAMVTSLYGGLAVYAQLAPELALTTADVTVLTTVLLVAHSLPVEARIAQRAGVRLWVTLTLRIVGGFVLGALLAGVLEVGGWLQTPVRSLWNPAPPSAGWVGWVLGQGQNLALMFVLMGTLIAVLRVAEWIGVTGRLQKVLAPLLRRLGLGPAAAPITVIGLTLGISYGGGLLIEESRSGRLAGREVFHALNLLGLSHSLIEDSLLMLAVGGHAFGIFGARILFTLIAISVAVRVTRGLDEKRFSRLFLVRGN